MHTRTASGEVIVCITPSKQTSGAWVVMEHIIQHSDVVKCVTCGPEDEPWPWTWCNTEQYWFWLGLMDLLTRKTKNPPCKVDFWRKVVDMMVYFSEKNICGSYVPGLFSRYEMWLTRLLKHILLPWKGGHAALSTVWRWIYFKTIVTKNKSDIVTIPQNLLAGMEWLFCELGVTQTVTLL